MDCIFYQCIGNNVGSQVNDLKEFKNGDLVNGIGRYFELLRDISEDSDKTFLVFTTVKTEWCPPCRVLTKTLLGNTSLKDEHVWKLSTIDSSGFWNNFIKDSPNIIKDQIKDLVDIFFDPAKYEDLPKQKNGQFLEANKLRLEKLFTKMVDKNEMIEKLIKIVVEKLKIIGVLVDGDNDIEIDNLAKYGINVRGFPTTIAFISSVDQDFIDYEMTTGADIKNFYIKVLEMMTLFIVVTYCE